MNSDAAKEILSAYRSDGRDEADPIFRDALNQVEQDADLKKWFEEQTAVDRAILQKLAAVQPPADLKAKILAQIRGQKVRRFALPPVWLAAAACLVLGGIAFFFSGHRGGPDMFQQFRTDALAMVSVQGGPALDFRTPSLAATQSYLEQHQVPYYTAIPAKLKDMQTAGCTAFVWKENPASLTCFRLPNGKLLHLVVISREAIQGGSIPSGMKSMGDWHIMFQQRNGMLLMWATQAPMEELKQMFVLVVTKEFAEFNQ